MGRPFTDGSIGRVGPESKRPQTHAVAVEERGRGFRVPGLTHRLLRRVLYLLQWGPALQSWLPLRSLQPTGRGGRVPWTACPQSRARDIQVGGADARGPEEAKSLSNQSEKSAPAL